MGDIGPPVAGVMGILFRIGITIGAVAVEMAACGHCAILIYGDFRDKKEGNRHFGVAL